MKGSLRWIRVEVVGLVKAPAVAREPNRVRADAIFMVGCLVSRIFVWSMQNPRSSRVAVMLTSRKI